LLHRSPRHCKTTAVHSLLYMQDYHPFLLAGIGIKALHVAEKLPSSIPCYICRITVRPIVSIEKKQLKPSAPCEHRKTSFLPTTAPNTSTVVDPLSTAPPLPTSSATALPSTTSMPLWLLDPSQHYHCCSAPSSGDVLTSTSSSTANQRLQDR